MTPRVIYLGPLRVQFRTTALWAVGLCVNDELTLHWLSYHLIYFRAFSDRRTLWVWANTCILTLTDMHSNCTLTWGRKPQSPNPPCFVSSALVLLWPTTELSIDLLPSTAFSPELTLQKPLHAPSSLIHSLQCSSLTQINLHASWVCWVCQVVDLCYDVSTQRMLGERPAAGTCSTGISLAASRGQGMLNH